MERNDYKAFDEDTKKFYLDTKHVQSGMVQGWNKFCLTGGIVEFSAKLPGKASVGGLWPACEYNMLSNAIFKLFLTQLGLFYIMNEFLLLAIFSCVHSVVAWQSCKSNICRIS